MSLSYVDSGIILRTPAGMGSVMHSQAVTLLRVVPAALVLFALAIAGVINQDNRTHEGIQPKLDLLVPSLRHVA